MVVGANEKACRLENCRLRESLYEAQEMINWLSKQIHRLTGKEMYKVKFDPNASKLLITDEILED